MIELHRRWYRADAPWSQGVRAALLVLAGLAIALPPAAVAAQAAQPGRRATAHAEPQETRILMLRPGGDVSTPRAAALDGVLARALAELGFAVTSSPLPFRDAQLVAGCTGTLRECGSEVAKALESEHLAVALIEEAARGTRLTLFVFESGGAVREGTTELPAAPDAPPEPAVHALVTRVFGLSTRAGEVAVPTMAPPGADAARAAQHPPPAEHHPEVLRTIGWTSLGAGGALLVGALATSISAENASQAYADSKVQSRAEADRALAHYETARHRADVARVLWGVGAGTAAAAAFMLLWQRLALPADRNLQNSQRASGAARPAVRVAAMPTQLGVSFALSGEL